MEICKGGKHTLVDIYWVNVGYGEEEVVRWCSYCGSIVIDSDVDGRLMGHVMKMKNPQLMKEMVDENNEK